LAATLGVAAGFETGADWVRGFVAAGAVMVGVGAGVVTAGAVVVAVAAVAAIADSGVTVVGDDSTESESDWFEAK
jgi:hypothetical protein